MNLLIVRHGEAENKDPGFSDADRALTKKGRKEMKEVAAGLKELVPSLFLLARSPLVRAVETAEFILEEYPGLKSIERTELIPGESLESLVNWLAKQEADGTIALVGHEPSLSVLASWLLCGSSHSIITLKKAGGCLIEFEDGVGKGTGALLWLMTPEQICRME